MCNMLYKLYNTEVIRHNVYTLYPLSLLYCSDPGEGWIIYIESEL